MTTSPRTTIFCAVWNRDPDRHALLEGHRRCVLAQTEPVDVVYVFDDGDEPPEGLPGTHVIAPGPLTIYQAWNIATQVARTRYVMNLNLDDRLWPGAAAVLADTADANAAGLVGGDWLVTFDRTSTDTPQDVRPAATVPFDAAWPPRAGVSRRLGSGTGENGTLGVGTLWRRDLHDRVPYPWRFADGTDILSVGDTIWWRVAHKAMQVTSIRLPVLVGSYHSNPAEQAEFRLPDETARIGEPLSFEQYPLSELEVRRNG